MLIVIEGMDGAGTTTHSIDLFRNLEVEFGNTRRIRRFVEPGGTRFGESVRELIFEYEALNPVTDALLFNAARVELINVIDGYLKQGDIIILDRYYPSTLAYQLPHCNKEENRLVTELTKRIVKDHQPDLLFYLDIPPEMVLSRKEGGKVEKFEKRGLEYYWDVRFTYREYFVKRKENWFEVDATQDIEEVRDILYNVSKTHILKKIGKLSG